MQRGAEVTKQGAMRSAAIEQGNCVSEGVAKQLQVLLPLPNKNRRSLLTQGVWRFFNFVEFK
jgi:hypothetical protein